MHWMWLIAFDNEANIACFIPSIVIWSCLLLLRGLSRHHQPAGSRLTGPSDNSLLRSGHHQSSFTLWLLLWEEATRANTSLLDSLRQETGWRSGRRIMVLSRMSMTWGIRRWWNGWRMWRGWAIDFVETVVYIISVGNWKNYGRQGLHFSRVQERKR